MVHPMPALRRIGAGDGAMLAAVVAVLAMQGAMLIAVVRRFILGAPAEGLEIASTEAWGTLVAVIATGTLGLVVWLVYREIRLDCLRHQAEIIDLLPSLRGVPELLGSWDAGAGRRDTQIAYHVQFADACYTTVHNGRQRIVLGKDFGGLWKAEPALARIKLAHEYSHVELEATSGERWTRLILKAYFLVLLGLIAVLVATLTYLEPAVINGRSVASLDFAVLDAPSHFWPSPDFNLILKLVTPLIVVAVAAAAVFVFSYFHLVRRELYHDLRAVQLTGDPQAAINLHQRSIAAIQQKGALRQWRSNIWTFFRCHPTAEARFACIANRDHLLISWRLFPLLVGALLPSALVASDFINPLHGEAEALWIIVQTAMVGLLIMLTLRSDSVRFGLSLQEGRRRTLFLIPGYAGMMGVGSAIAGALLTIWYWYRFDHDLHWLERNITSQVLIGARTATYFAVLLLALSWFARVRLARNSRGTRTLVWIEALVFAVIGVCGFMLLSSTSPEFVGPLLTIVVVVGGVWIGALHLMARGEEGL
jgi:hypothetical protein